MSQQAVMVIVEPVKILATTLDIATLGGTSTVGKIEIRTDAHFVPTHLDVQIYDKNGRITDEKHGIFTLNIRYKEAAQDWQNQAFDVHVLNELSRSMVFRSWTLMQGTELEITAAHDPFCNGDDATDVAPFRVKFTMFGMYINYQ